MAVDGQRLAKLLNMVAADDMTASTNRYRGFEMTPTKTAQKFMLANDKSNVISGYANREGGGGGYTLANGKSFTLTVEDARSLPEGYPKWGFPTNGG